MYDILINQGFTPDQAQKLIRYKDLLLECNEKINLTAITDDTEIAYKHFADSVTPLAFADFKNKSVIDVGTGAGFPGLPIKIAEPSVKLTLLDSLNKRINFLNMIVSELSLENVSCIHARAEEAGRTDLREYFDIALSRAVADLSVLAEYCLPFVKVDGLFIALKGPSPEEEIEKAKRAVKTLGGKIENTRKITISDFTHTIILIRKTSATPKAYPRAFAKIKNKPL